MRFSGWKKKSAGVSSRSKTVADIGAALAPVRREADDGDAAFPRSAPPAESGPASVERRLVCFWLTSFSSGARSMVSRAPTYSGNSSPSFGNWYRTTPVALYT